MVDKGIKILVVDDFPTMRRIIRNLLKELGFENVDEAEDGAIGLEKLRNGGFQFVVSDWNAQPRRPGNAQADPRRRRAGHAAGADGDGRGQKENIVAAAQAGANGYVVKPFTAATLEESSRRSSRKSQAEVRHEHDGKC